MKKLEGTGGSSLPPRDGTAPRDSSAPRRLELDTSASAERLERSANVLRASLTDLDRLYEVTGDPDVLVTKADTSAKYTQVLCQLTEALKKPKDT